MSWCGKHNYIDQSTCQECVVDGYIKEISRLKQELVSAKADIQTHRQWVVEALQQLEGKKND